MSKKKRKPVPLQMPAQERKLVIDMNKANLAKEYTAVSFRTGKHMSEKDRPRKKDWKREYERGSGKHGYGSPDFSFCRNERRAA